jgi:N-acetylmuramoyl-L-alanine amidase
MGLAAQPPGTPASARFRVMVDPGHGGEDRGAKGPKGLTEKDAALQLAQSLGRKLEAAGFQVLFTREEDVFIPLWDRPKLANDAGADLFVSLHLNAARARGAKGSEVYFLALGKGDAEAAEVAALENQAGLEGTQGPPLDVVDSILEDLAQKAFLHDSENLAVRIQTELNRLGGIKERGVKQAPFVVLKGAAMPAVLVETAFISNPREEAKLKDPAFRAKVAEAITKGIQRFLGDGHLPAKRRVVATGR